MANIATILIFQNSQIHMAKCLEDIIIFHTRIVNVKEEEKKHVTSVACFQLPHA